MPRKRALLYLITGFLLGLVISTSIWFFLNSNNNKVGEEFVLEYGELFTIPMLNHTGDRVDMNSLTSEYTIVFYLDDNCGSCIDSLIMAGKVSNIFEKTSVQNIILWNGKNGMKLSQKHGLSDDSNYTIENGYIKTPTPTFGCF